MTSLQEIEHALDHGLIRTRLFDGRLWSTRRNGATKRTAGGAWIIPVKYGFRRFAHITHSSRVGAEEDKDAEFVILSGANDV